MAAHNQQHLIELDGHKSADILLAVSGFVLFFAEPCSSYGYESNFYSASE